MIEYPSPVPSFRAQLLTRRSYNRPLDEAGRVFETWKQTVDRVVSHQLWLWERALNRPLNAVELSELEELRHLIVSRKISVSGRTLWLGGTDVAKKREASQFNCAFTKVENVYDVVDCFWLLLQGCGVGFLPVVGNLNGFSKHMDVEVIRSTRLDTGFESNTETYVDGVWTIRVGDSAEAWAKSAGKLLAGKFPARKLCLDFSEVRPGGKRLKGYGWISSGDATISKAFLNIAKIMNLSAGKLLTKINILDILNWLGTTLSSRRSSEICLVEYGSSEWEEFANAKKNYYRNGQEQRAMSNNTLLFYKKPSKMEMKGIFHSMISAGGSEPGFANAEAALKRAAYFVGFNPCAEILLGNKSFCNLVEVDLGKFASFYPGTLQLRHAIKIAARANYRQTCVDLRDGILSASWHELNTFLHLCGVGLTGVVRFLDKMVDESNHAKGIILASLKSIAKNAAEGMANELNLPVPQNVTTVKPSGTLGKVMDTTEGIHRPLGRYIFNNINFSKHDPLISVLREAGYRMFPSPHDCAGMVVTVPVESDAEFTEVSVGGHTLEVNTETAIEQLERYKLMMDFYVDNNCSITVSYDPTEVDAIVNWLDHNWNSFVAVAWLFRNDPTKTAADLGYPYLPQEVVTKQKYDQYVATLEHVNIDQGNSHDAVDAGSNCAGGACPIR